MFLLTGVRLYRAGEPVDVRQSSDGLRLLVSHVLGQDPFSAPLFVFTNRRRDKLKVLHYDVNGFALYYNRLERGRFRWPAIPAGQTGLVIDDRQFQWLLSGLSLEQRQALPAVQARVVA